MSEVRSTQGQDKTDTQQHGRSIKQLKSSLESAAYQKEWFKDTRERIIQGEPFVLAQADAPHEIFLVMDIPVVPVQWWSALIAAKQLSAKYFNLMEEKGYTNLCHYCSLPLACTMDHNPARAPWGGLPKPLMLIEQPRCESISKIFELWAREYQTALFVLDYSASMKPYYRWWEQKENWNDRIETHRLELRLEELKALIRFLEISTGRIFNRSKFIEIMELEKEQQDYFKKARDLIAETVPCPLGLPDEMPSTMIPQWHKGTKWGRDHAKMFYEEVKERVRKGEAAYKSEKLRLMWSGGGLWHNTSFYNYFEEKYGAVFVCSGYLSRAADGYIGDFRNDPLKALAGHNLFPLGSDDWLLKEAKLYKVNGAITNLSRSCQELILRGPIFMRKTFEEGGIPVLPLYSDIVDSREWDDAKVISTVSDFIEKRLLSNEPRRISNAT